MFKVTKLEKTDVYTTEVYGVVFPFSPYEYQEDIVFTYCAVDKSGAVYLYEKEPVIDCNTWTTFPEEVDCVYLGDVSFEGDWKDSLVEVTV